MIAPANPENGKQLTYTAFSGYVNPTSYTFEGVEEGNYTVGVQAVTYSWQASEFSTTDVNLNENPTSAFTVVYAPTISLRGRLSPWCLPTRLGGKKSSRSPTSR